MSYLTIIVIAMLGVVLVSQARKQADARRQRVWRIAGMACLVIALVIALTDIVVDIVDEDAELAPRGIAIEGDEDG